MPVHGDPFEIERSLDLLQDVVVDLVAVPQPHERVVLAPEQGHAQVGVLLLPVRSTVGGGLVAFVGSQDPQPPVVLCA